MWPPAKITTIREARMARGARGPAPLSMTVQPMVRTRKKVPISSTRYLFIFISLGVNKDTKQRMRGGRARAEVKKNRARCRREQSPLVNPGLTLCEAGGVRLVIFAHENGRGDGWGIE